MRRIRTEAFIPFPPEPVWTVLTDFEAYALWNPLNVRASGLARLGARIPMTFVNPGRKGTIDQIVTIIECEPMQRLAWRGRIPLLFTGEHFFDLSPSSDGTRLLHGEDQSGLIPMTFTRARIADHFVPAYEAMNRALAARVAEVMGG